MERTGWLGDQAAKDAGDGKEARRRRGQGAFRADAPQDGKILRNRPRNDRTNDSKLGESLTASHLGRYSCPCTSPRIAAVRAGRGRHDRSRGRPRANFLEWL